MMLTREKVEYELTKNGRTLDDYIVILGGERSGDTLYSVEGNFLFAEIIENNELSFACIELLKSKGVNIFNNLAELRNKRPEIVT